MRIKDNIKSQLIRQGFSLAEVLIVLVCVIVISVLLLQVLKKIVPDREERMYKKAFNITARVVPALVANDALYPEVDGLNALQNLGNTEWVMYEGKKYEGETKFCGLFGAKLNAVSAVDCSAKTKFTDGELPNGTLTTNDGIVWQLPITKFDNLKVPGEIYLDTNGDKKPNCFYKSGSCESPDRYTIYVYQDGTVSDTPVNMPDLPVLADATPETDFEIPSNWQPSTPNNPDTVPIENTNPEPLPVEPTSPEEPEQPASSEVPATDTTPSVPETPTLEDPREEETSLPSYKRSLGLSGGYVYFLFEDSINRNYGGKKEAWKRWLPARLSYDTNRVNQLFATWYSILQTDPEIDPVALYAAYKNVTSLYERAMYHVYTNCANTKALEKGSGDWVTFKWDHTSSLWTILSSKTYKLAFAQDDDGKEFKKGTQCRADRQTPNAIGTNYIGIWLYVKRDKWMYGLEVNTQTFISNFEKLYQAEYDFNRAQESK